MHVNLLLARRVAIKPRLSRHHDAIRVLATSLPQAHVEAIVFRLIIGRTHGVDASGGVPTRHGAESQLFGAAALLIGLVPALRLVQACSGRTVMLVARTALEARSKSRYDACE